MSRVGGVERTMLFATPHLLVAQAPPSPKAAVAYGLTAAKAIASYELAAWRKLHPKADLAVSFSDPAVTPALANLIRQRLGFKDPLPVLNAQVLTIVFDTVSVSAPKRLTMDAYVFQGSFPKGFRARYIVRTDGKEPKVASLAILQRYDIDPGREPKKPNPTIT